MNVAYRHVTQPVVTRNMALTRRTDGSGGAPSVPTEVSRRPGGLLPRYGLVRNVDDLLFLPLIGLQSW